MHPERLDDDRGSITPLVIGMVLCLLLLGAGVTAAGSAFLAGQRLRHMCDGAAATAAGAITDAGATTTTADSLRSYFADRGDEPAVDIDLRGPTLSLTCSADYPVTFGALFGSPTVHRTVTSTARTHLSTTA
ncbi:Putative Flp pilus-assembly TadE/G-like [Nakamurella panacisegetis]|uniref:Putative Flp pilus-assembly TadE/G-like n=1 Tax=Nakamurella panacisegetis TaxID=1090615 RepID=A0A1H0HJT9_9ACTN|nr:pilus assembly protein TadG-related protein [Nakamurella panacisegetis]SDO19314.1 Putative Flp pilus-assembly TadE/G-like [Nakamurella panacisegetis]